MTDDREHDAEADGARPPDPNAVAVTINGEPVTARKGELIIKAAERQRRVHPAVLLPRADGVGRHVPACASSRSTPAAGPQLQPSCMVTVAPDMKVETESPTSKRAQEGMHRAAARQPPARLPGVRQGWRVPAAGPGVQPRPRREPLRRGEAALREADPDQRPRLPRPRAVHPVRPLHPLRRRGGRRRADPLHRPRQPHPGQHVPRRAVLVATSAATPCRSARSARSTAKPYRFKARPWDLDESRAPARGARSAAASSVQSSRDEVVRYHGVDSDPVNWGWLCDRGRFGFEATNSADRARRRRSC